MGFGASTRPLRPARGGRLAPLLSATWGPLVLKSAFALGAIAVLAFIGARAGANPPTVVMASAGAAAATPVPASIAAAPSGSAPAPVASDAGVSISPGILPDGRVVLNVADEEALKTLPGIGPKRAQAILALRQRLVRFRAVEDLLRVKGIGRKTLAKIKPKVVLNGAE